MISRSPISDSPWFWVLIFAGMALVALLAMGPKYRGRQARMEVKYQARERIEAERAGKNNPGDASRINDGNRAERRAFASPDETLIPLWPLAVVLAIVMVFSLVMLIRERGRLATASSEQPGSPRDESLP